VNPWMTPPPDLPSLDSPEKDALIVALIARIDALVAENTALRTRVAELEAKLGLPPKTPNNSSTPPSQGRKASADAATKPALRPKLRGKPHAGAHRPLHPNPTARRDLMATACQHCGANVSSAPQIAYEAYDHVEIPEIKPDITRVTLFGGTCPCCAKRFKAPSPQGLEPGSPFVPNLRAFVVYLRFTQGISFERLAKLLAPHQRRRAGQHAGGGPPSLRHTDKPDPRAAPVWNRAGIGRDRRAGRQTELVAMGLPSQGQRRLRR